MELTSHYVFYLSVFSFEREDYERFFEMHNWCLTEREKSWDWMFRNICYSITKPRCRFLFFFSTTLFFFLILCLYFYFGSESRGKWQKMMASIVSEIERGPQRLHCTGGLACLPLPFSHCFTGAWGSGHSSCSFSTWTLSSVRLQSFSSFVG